MHLDQDGNYATQVLEDGRVLYVFPILFGKARLAISHEHSPLFYDAVY